jgi:hypothetical protein
MGEPVNGSRLTVPGFYTLNLNRMMSPSETV